MTWPEQISTGEELLRYIKIETKRAALQHSLNMTIWYKHNIAGMIGFDYFDMSNKLSNLWFWLSKVYEGRGIMTVACRHFVSMAFNLLHLNRIEMRCAVNKVRSRNIAIKTGFIQEGILREAQRLQQGFVDLVLYSQLNKMKDKVIQREG